MGTFKDLTYRDYLKKLTSVQFENYNPLDRESSVQGVARLICDSFQKKSSCWVMIVHAPDFKVDDPGPNGLRVLSCLPKHEFPLYGLAGEEDWKDPTERHLRFLREVWREAGRLYITNFQSQTGGANDQSKDQSKDDKTKQ